MPTVIGDTATRQRHPLITQIMDAIVGPVPLPLMTTLPTAGVGAGLQSLRSLLDNSRRPITITKPLPDWLREVIERENSSRGVDPFPIKPGRAPIDATQALIDHLTDFTPAADTEQQAFQQFLKERVTQRRPPAYPPVIDISSRTPLTLHGAPSMQESPATVQMRDVYRRAGQYDSPLYTTVNPQASLEAISQVGGGRVPNANVVSQATSSPIAGHVRHGGGARTKYLDLNQVRELRELAFDPNYASLKPPAAINALADWALEQYRIPDTPAARLAISSTLRGLERAEPNMRIRPDIQAFDWANLQRPRRRL